MAGKRGGKRYGRKKQRKKIKSELGHCASNLEKKMTETRNRKQIGLVMINGDESSDFEENEENDESILDSKSLVKSEEGESEIKVREVNHNKRYREFSVSFDQDRIKLAVSSSTKFLKNWWFVTTKRFCDIKMIQNQNQKSAIVVDLLLRADGETLWIFAYLDRVLIFKSIPGVTRFPSLMKKFFEKKDKPKLLRFSADNTELLQTLRQYNFRVEDNMLYYNLSRLLLVEEYISLDRASQAFWGITVNGGIEIHDLDWIDFDLDEIDLEKIGVAAVNGYFLGQMFRCIAKEVTKDVIM